jgi:hypothetical protein
MTMTLEAIKEELRNVFPVFIKGSEETGYEEFSSTEYEEMINSYAQEKYTEYVKEQEEAEKLIQKNAILERLGLSAQEAEILFNA